ELHEHLDEGDHYRVATDQLLSDDRARAEEKLAEMAKHDPAQYKERRERARKAALALAAELSKSSRDEDKIFDTLGFTKGPEDTELIRQAYREVCPERTGLFNDIDKALSGKDEKEA